MIIAGAGGHAREIRMLMDSLPAGPLYFFDNTTADAPSSIDGLEVVRTQERARQILGKDPRFIIGTGGSAVRRTLCELLQGWGGEPFSFIAASAMISGFETSVGTGVNIMHAAFISSSVRVGDGSLINTSSQLHHEVVTGHFCEVGPAAVLLGKVRLGSNVSIGAGAILLPEITIGDGAIIGAGAVVTKNVRASQTVKGVPAV